MSPSATEPDWSREAPRGFWDPGRKLIGAVRDYQRGGPLRRRLAVLRHRFWSLVSGAELPVTTDIGGGLMLPHPNGVVVHPKSVIGPNCILFQQVTLGGNAGGSGVAADWADMCDVGPGARILGPVRIGRQCA